MVTKESAELWPMVEDRHLNWPDCANARDLGGLPLAGGGTVARGALVRADTVDRLTPTAGRRCGTTASGP